jgi:DNA-binding transcriptional LysR family regulator
MNETRVDLNLFHIFHAVMTERNVTRAAQRLAMTQPAVSNALSRLRCLLQDDLFTRGRGGVQPTERALMMWPDIQDAIGKIRTFVVPPEFDAAKSRQIFNVAITYPLRYSLVPALAVYFAARAPHVKLHLHPHTDLGSITELEAGRLDCAVGMFPQPPRELHVEPLFADDYVCVLRRGHPLLGCRLTLKAFAAANHVLIKSSGGGYSVVDAWLSLKGLTRQISLIVNQFEDALEVLKDTNLVAAIPQRLARMAIRADCKIVKLPFASEKILYKMLWHERTNSSAAQIWLRSTIRTLLMDSYVQSRDKSGRRTATRETSTTRRGRPRRFPFA